MKKIKCIWTWNGIAKLHLHRVYSWVFVKKNWKNIFINEINIIFYLSTTENLSEISDKYSWKKVLNSYWLSKYVEIYFYFLFRLLHCIFITWTSLYTYVCSSVMAHFVLHILIGLTCSRSWYLFSFKNLVVGESMFALRIGRH